MIRLKHLLFEQLDYNTWRNKSDSEIYDLLKDPKVSADIIANVLNAAKGGSVGNDYEAWVEAAVNSINSQNVYNSVTKILRKDVKEFILDFMNEDELNTKHHVGPPMITKLNSFSTKTIQVTKHKNEPVFLYLQGKLQKLLVYKQGQLLKTYKVSTGAAGFGNESGSGKTPIGLRTISRKAGADLPDYTLMVNLKGVKDTDGQYVILPVCDSLSAEIKRKLINIKNFILPGELSSKEKAIINCEAHVLTRALVVDANRGVYIHGTNRENSLGTPLSGGCIRMSNDNVKELFNMTPVGTKIYIDPYS